jgi:hypothetical protein
MQGRSSEDDGGVQSRYVDESEERERRSWTFSEDVINMLYSLSRALQLIGLAITFVVVVLFFDSSYKMGYLMTMAITGMVTFYAGWFLQR